jgi:hypothetical protein
VWARAAVAATLISIAVVTEGWNLSESLSVFGIKQLHIGEITRKDNLSGTPCCAPRCIGKDVAVLDSHPNKEKRTLLPDFFQILSTNKIVRTGYGRVSTYIESDRLYTLISRFNFFFFDRDVYNSGRNSIFALECRSWPFILPTWHYSHGINCTVGISIQVYSEQRQEYPGPLCVDQRQLGRLGAISGRSGAFYTHLPMQPQPPLA